MLNENWKFHIGEVGMPKKLSKKAHALGGFTASIIDEPGEIVPCGEGGKHFLKLIARGNEKEGLIKLAETDYNARMDDSWKDVSLPHDWKTEQSLVNDSALLMSGFKEEGIGYYRKQFLASSLDPDNSRIILHFEGVMRLADVWLNGAYLGQNISGYSSFSFDITEMLHYEKEQPNTLLIRVDTTTGSEGWWYEGAGVYKQVWLEIRPLVSIDQESAYVYTKVIDKGNVILGIEMTVKNESEFNVKIQPRIEILGRSLLLAEKIVLSNERYVFSHEISFKEEEIIYWSPENPHLNNVVFQIESDQCVKKFGIRTFSYLEDGFYLNGELYQLKGVCEHQDFGGLGVALNQDIVDYKVLMMKKMGVNAWRSAHHFASEELLKACDKHGMILINENRLLESTPWRVNDLKKMVIKSRMHACLGFWSIANEEVIGNTVFGSRIVRRLARTIKQNNNECLVVSAELLNPEGVVTKEYFDHLNVLGVNYPEASVMGSGAIKIKKQYPKLPIMTTESASYFSTRGSYIDNEIMCECSNFGSSFSMILPGKRKPNEPGVGGTATPEQVIKFLTERPYMSGVFLWTAMDYYGEPIPFGWPAKSSQFGITDICGFPKDYYYFYKAQWTKEKMIHIMPHWNKEGLSIDKNGNVDVRVFSNMNEVELFINEVSYGKKQSRDCIFEWKVPYIPGVVQAWGGDYGKRFITSKQITSGPAVKVKVELLHQGTETNLYSISALDKDNCFVPTAMNEVSFFVTGGIVLGCENGSPINTKTKQESRVSLFNGKAMIIVKKVTESIHLDAELCSD